jgi:hypothetical protein
MYILFYLHEGTSPVNEDCLARHTEQHLQAEHGQICRSHPSHEEVWDIDMF